LRKFSIRLISSTQNVNTAIWGRSPRYHLKLKKKEEKEEKGDRPLFFETVPY
jgi:hypothetical protein